MPDRRRRASWLYGRSIDRRRNTRRKGLGFTGPLGWAAAPRITDYAVPPGSTGVALGSVGSANRRDFAKNPKIRRLPDRRKVEDSFSKHRIGGVRRMLRYAHFLRIGEMRRGVLYAGSASPGRRGGRREGSSLSLLADPRNWRQ